METDCTHLKRQIELLRLDLERLNKLIYKEATNKTSLERNNLLSENENTSYIVIYIHYLNQFHQ